MSSSLFFFRTMGSASIVFAGFVQGCAAPVDSSSDGAREDAVARASSEIKGGAFAGASDLAPRSVVSIGNAAGTWDYCTGTIVGRKHILTAAHCNVQNKDKIHFYTGYWPNGDFHTVMAHYEPAGRDNNDMVSGYLGDISLLVLDSPIDLTRYRIAEIPRGTSGNGRYLSGASEWPVGRGQHDGAGNPSSFLKWNTAQLFALVNPYSSVVELANEATDKGDSGGPIFVFGSSTSTLMTLGVLSGRNSWGVDEYSNTSVWAAWIDYYIAVT